MFRKAIKYLATVLVGAIIVIAILALALCVFVGGAALLNHRTPSETDFSKSRLLAHPPEPLFEEITLKIVTFNIQNLWVAGRNRPERMRAIAETLRNLDPDIVGIQEGFVKKDRNILLEELEGSRLAHHQYFPSALVGSGLLTLSAFPIVEAYFTRYDEAGDWYKVYEGDWWAGKGASLTRIELPDGAGIVDFYNTHAQAGYGNPAYKIVRAAQMEQLAGFIRATATGTAPAFQVGDMNCRPNSKEYEIVTGQAGLVRLMTIDSRIDHIFGVKDERYVFEVIHTASIERRIPVPGGETRLSDHTGYMSTIRIRPVPGGTSENGG